MKDGEVEVVRLLRLRGIDGGGEEFGRRRKEYTGVFDVVEIRGRQIRVDELDGDWSPERSKQKRLRLKQNQEEEKIEGRHENWRWGGTNSAFSSPGHRKDGLDRAAWKMEYDGFRIRGGDVIDVDLFNR